MLLIFTVSGKDCIVRKVCLVEVKWFVDSMISWSAVIYWLLLSFFECQKCCFNFKYQDLLLLLFFFVIYDSELIIFWFFGWIKQDIWRCHPGLWDVIVGNEVFQTGWFIKKITGRLIDKENISCSPSPIEETDLRLFKTICLLGTNGCSIYLTWSLGSKLAPDVPLVDAKNRANSHH